MKTTRRLRHLLRLQRGWAWLGALSLAWAIVGVQTLGLAHALAHGVVSPAVVTAQAADRAAGDDGFGHAAGGAHCLLFTALSAGHLLASATVMPVIAAVDPSPGPAATHEDRASVLARAFDARGPPEAMTVLV